MDLGASTGRSLTDGADTEPALDTALTSILTSLPEGFGADFGFGTIGMASFSMGSDLGGSVSAGWRQLGGLAVPTDLAWLDGDVRANADAASIEARIPLATLFPQGIPAEGTTVGIIVRLGNATGEFLSNQGLPEPSDPSTPGAATAAATLTVLPIR